MTTQVSREGTLQEVMASQQAELLKGRVDLVKLLSLVSMVNMFFHQQFAHDERMLQQQYANEGEAKVYVIAEGKTSKGQLASQLLSAFVTLSSSTAGAYGVYNGVANLPEIAQFCTTGARGVDVWTQMANDSRQARQTIDEAELRVIEQKRDSSTQDARQHEQQAQAALDSAKRIEEMLHQFFMQMQ